MTMRREELLNFHLSATVSLVRTRVKDSRKEMDLFVPLVYAGVSAMTGLKELVRGLGEELVEKLRVKAAVAECGFEYYEPLRKVAKGVLNRGIRKLVEALCPKQEDDGILDASIIIRYSVHAKIQVRGSDLTDDHVESIEMCSVQEEIDPPTIRRRPGLLVKCIRDCAKDVIEGIVKDRIYAKV